MSCSLQSKEHTRQVRDEVVQKYKEGLVIKKKDFPGFEHLTQHCAIYYLEMKVCTAHMEDCTFWSKFKTQRVMENSVYIFRQRLADFRHSKVQNKTGSEDKNRKH